MTALHCVTLFLLAYETSSLFLPLDLPVFFQIEMSLTAFPVAAPPPIGSWV